MAHTVAQPGLHAHSWDAETDLMKKYVLEVKTESGWLAVESHASRADALDAFVSSVNKGIDDLLFIEYRVYDQFSNEAVVWGPDDLAAGQ
jgi:hypothetical protein